MDPRTVQAAEQQMRRTAPDEHTAKRRKVDDGESAMPQWLFLQISGSRSVGPLKKFEH